MRIKNVKIEKYRDLEVNFVIRRVEYSLTELGESVLPVIMTLGKYGVMSSRTSQIDLVLKDRSFSDRR